MADAPEKIPRPPIWLREWTPLLMTLVGATAAIRAALTLWWKSLPEDTPVNTRLLLSLAGGILCGFSYLLFRNWKLRETPLYIRRAKYGIGTAQKDVSGILRAHMKDSSLSIPVTNEQLGGDPCPFKGKDLVVEYSFNGKRLKKIARETEILELP